MAKASEEATAESMDASKGFRWWKSPYFQENMGKLLGRLAADPTLVPCVREEDTEDGQRGLYFFVGRVGKDGKLEQDGEGFNNSHNCPPFCPNGDE